MKKKVSFLIFLGICCASSLYASVYAVAKIEDKVFTNYDLMNFVKRSKLKKAVSLEKLSYNEKKLLLDRFVNEKLIIEDFKNSGLVIPDIILTKIIEDKLKNMVQEINFLLTCMRENRPLMIIRKSCSLK